MVIYLKIDKIAEDIENVTYKFVDALRDTNDEGVLVINKENGDFKIIKSLQDDVDYKLAACVYSKIMDHFEKGECPDKTCYAA